jgi:hypothetical protein
MSVIASYAKLSRGAKLLEFGANTDYFNHAVGKDVFRASVRKQLTDSMEIVVEGGAPDLFKLTNQNLVTWDDYWVDRKSDQIVDPGIRNLNLQRNRLVYVNMNTPRVSLEKLNLEGNFTLRHLYIHEAPELEMLNITGCTGLEYVALGVNKNIRTLLARNCQMSPSVMEQLLRDFTPTVTANANLRGAGAFRKQHSTLLDLSGNTVDWGNKRIASKIRLLLTNNWIVKWDNNPPSEVIPPQLYGFFVESQLGL